ncbi:MAG: transposase family protein [Thiofilum sp.]|uniref:transposase family protein n=1 Tax=Thiofilum sp. TaxID=2212733 RepID=UPI0025E1DE7D|nr:transposase family protein [Thiofilum sp.]MBK8454994.1 transposase family protein [Thiofilum sp.]
MLPPSVTTISRLLEQLSGLEDPRQQAKVLYPLPEILLLGLASSLAGADDIVEMVRWAKLNADSCAAIIPMHGVSPTMTR